MARARPRDPALVLDELQALRREVARTRETVYELEATSGSCVWQLWGEGWLLRVSGIADLIPFSRVGGGDGTLLRRRPRKEKLQPRLQARWKSLKVPLLPKPARHVD